MKSQVAKIQGTWPDVQYVWTTEEVSDDYFKGAISLQQAMKDGGVVRKRN